MRILVITPYYYPALIYGGPSFSVYYLVQGLAEAGAQVKVLTTNANGNRKLDIPLRERVLVGGVPTEYHPLSPFFTKRYFYSHSLKKSIVSQIHNFDLVHIQGTFVYPTLIAAKESWLAGKPFIITPRGAWDPWSLRQKRLKKKLYFEVFERRWINRAVAIHYTTEAEKRLANRLGLKVPGFVVPNPVFLEPLESEDAPLKFRKYWGIPENAPVILFLGRIHPKKGVGLLFSAFADLRRSLPEAWLIIAGPDGEGFTNHYKKLAASLGVSDHIVWTGLVSGSEKTACYYAADIFVLPSHQENFGMAVAEAMLCELPVLISPGVNLANFVLKYGAGEVIPLNNRLWTIKIIEWLKNDERRKSAGKYGNKAAKKAFSIDSVARQMINIYLKILKGEKLDDNFGH